MHRAEELNGAVHYSPLSIMSMITDYLYLSSIRVATDEQLLKENGITHIVDATTEAESNHKYEIPVECMKIKIDDVPESKIGPYFDMVADKIEKVKKQGGKVLVHCVAGVSRSSTLVIAYLMKYQQITLKEAHDLVKSKRSLISPNAGFWQYLIDYEKKLFDKNTVTMKQSRVGMVPDFRFEAVKDLM